MLKRIWWVSVGMAIGIGTSFWVLRMVREVVARYSPERVADDLARGLRSFGDDLRTALAEGRTAMHATEATLRAELRRH